MNKEEKQVYDREYRERNKERISNLRRQKDLDNPEAYRERLRRQNYKRCYGITIEQYENMFAAQNGLCAICRRPERILDRFGKAPKRLAVDHCHITNKIRKLLCHSCNTAIGHLNHDKELVKQAALYLESN